MKWDPKYTPLVVRGAVTLIAVGCWYFYGKPVDEVQLRDFVDMTVALFLGKELIKRTGD